MENKPAIAVLCKEFNQHIYNFYNNKELNFFFDVFFVIDNYNTGDGFVSEEQIVKLGYHNSVAYPGSISQIKKNPCAWDKFAYLFCEVEKKYETVIVVEEDVFVNSPESFLILYERFKEQKADLFTTRHEEMYATSSELKMWHWPQTTAILGPPYYFSLTCAMVVSRKLLNVVAEFVAKHKTLLFHEIMYNTLAEHNGLKAMFTQQLLGSIYSHGSFTVDYVLRTPFNFFHPVKQFENHERIRKMIKLAEEIKYIPQHEHKYDKYFPQGFNSRSNF